MVKNIIITAGGTSEKIDDVRTITNISSGRLAMSICLRLLQSMKDIKIYYICGQRALRPSVSLPGVSIIQINDTEDLSNALQNLHGIYPDVFIHSMAVSDFKPVMFKGKMSSNTDNPQIKLTPTSKVIDKIRFFFPDTILFGFKLESGITRTELFKRARRLMTRSGCNYVIANLISDISLFFHNGWIIDKEKTVSEFYSKSDCSKKITEIIYRRTK